MAQWLRLLAALAKEQNLVPNAHVGKFTTAVTQFPEHLKPSSSLCMYLLKCVRAHTLRQTHIFIIKTLFPPMDQSV